MPRALALIGVAAVTAALAACTAARESPTVDAPSGATTTAGARPAPSASASTPSPDAVERELMRFDAVNRRIVERKPSAGGRAFIDGLVAAGYRKADMQVTEDRTTIGLAVPSVQFSVLWRGVCLIGQHGPMSGGYHGVTGEPIDGRCLIGKTRAIDW